MSLSEFLTYLRSHPATEDLGTVLAEAVVTAARVTSEASGSRHPCG